MAERTSDQVDFRAKKKFPRREEALYNEKRVNTLARLSYLIYVGTNRGAKYVKQKLKKN